jgi:hypothetical protein
MTQQFWVIGGEYCDGDFSALAGEQGQVYGPFGSYAQAHDVWRERSVETRCVALMRFSIVTNAPTQPGAERPAA